MNDFTVNLHGECLEYFDDEHIYLVDGVQVPSISDILSVRFGGKYKGVDPDVPKRAAQAGTAVHDAIHRYVEYGEESTLPEVRNFKFLQKHYGFKVIGSELPVILHENDTPIAAGRLDLVLEMNGQTGGADIKRTSTLDKDYLYYQLNLYRIAYQQSYGVAWDFLRGVHLKENIRKFVPIPINEADAWKLVYQWREKNE